MAESAWLIEINPPLGDVLYYCGPGDWCSNPNHAHKFPDKTAAKAVRSAMQNPLNMRIAEHEWADPLSDSPVSVDVCKQTSENPAP